MHETPTADENATHSMKLGVVTDLIMDPDEAREDEDPTDTVLFPMDRDYGEFPYRVLETVEMRGLYGENHPSDDDLPDVGEETEFGTVYWTDEDGFLRFEWSDEFAPEETDEEGF